LTLNIRIDIVLGVGRPALTLLRSQSAPAVGESLSSIVPTGRLVELSTPSTGPSARTSTAVTLLAHAQQQGETAVWLQPQGGPLYPPDLSEAGIDLDALVVIHVPASSGPHGACKAAELLLRSGAFGMLVLDLTAGVPPGSGEAWQGRLLALARQHQAKVVLLTDKPSHAASLGPLVGLRIESTRTVVGAESSELGPGSGVDGVVPLSSPTPLAPLRPGGGRRASRAKQRTPTRFFVHHSVLKNKTGKTLEPSLESYRGPWGI